MNKLSQIFKGIQEIEPRKDLKFLILQKIELEKEKQAKGKLILSYLGMAIFALIGIWALAYSGSTFLKSEFWSIFSLAFSDFVTVAGSWKEYLYSLGETLPVINIMAVLIPIFGVLLFLNMCIYFKNKVRDIHVHEHLRFKSI
jgi:hypothetical protein